MSLFRPLTQSDSTPTSGLSSAGVVVDGVVREAAHTLAAGARWLTGFGAERVVVPRGPSNGHTVLLVHGLGANKSYFRGLERELAVRGFAVCSLNYSWAGTRLDDCGRHVLRDVAAVRRVMPGSPIHIVGHSLGGVVARWACVRDEFASLATLGAPHGGAPLAALVPACTPVVGRVVSDLRRHSEALEALASYRTASDLPTLAVGGGLDVIVPWRSALLPAGESVRNLVVPGAGHIALPASPVVLAAVASHLDGAARPVAVPA